MATQTETATELFELQSPSKVAVATSTLHPGTSLESLSHTNSHALDAESFSLSTKPSILRTYLTIFTPAFVGFIASVQVPDVRTECETYTDFVHYDLVY
jgi:hypothetical protein